MRLNAWFEGRYAIAREAIVARLVAGEDPVVIRTEAELVLLCRGRRRTAPLLGPDYQHAKTVAHMPAVVYLLLGERAGQTLGDRRSLLEAFHTELVTARDETGQRRAEKRLLSICVKFVREVLADGHVGVEELAAFAKATDAPMRETMQLATRAYLDRLDRLVVEWTEDWTEDEWGRVSIVICAGHAPRYKESTRAYFTRLLGERHGRGAAGERQVLYAEGATCEHDALELAATHLLNRELGRMFLGSSVALQEDLLGDTARRVLDETFASSSTGTRPRGPS